MDVEEVAPGKARNLGSILMIVGAIGGLVVGLLVAAGVAGQTVYGFTGEQSQVAVWASVLPFLILIVVASVMLPAASNLLRKTKTSILSCVCFRLPQHLWGSLLIHRGNL